MTRTGPTNMELKMLIDQLRQQSSKEKVMIWKRVADDLSYSSRRRREVDLNDIERKAKDKETIVIPGKVLGTGILHKHVTVAAWKFSKSASDKLGEKAISIHELIKNNHKGKNVRIIG